MNPDSMKALRLDRRLLRRRGWISAEELERQLAALPDVAEKARPLKLDEVPAAPEVPAPGGGAGAGGL